MDVVPVLALLSLVFAAGIWVGAVISERAAEAIDEELDKEHRSAGGLTPARTRRLCGDGLLRAPGVRPRRRRDSDDRRRVGRPGVAGRVVVGGPGGGDAGPLDCHESEARR